MHCCSPGRTSPRSRNQPTQALVALIAGRLQVYVELLLSPALTRRKTEYVLDVIVYDTSRMEKLDT
jgi:hypothetical protein